jgi:hypothetical protein
VVRVFHLAEGQADMGKDSLFVIQDCKQTVMREHRYDSQPNGPNEKARSAFFRRILRCQNHSQNFGTIGVTNKQHYIYETVANET